MAEFSPWKMKDTNEISIMFNELRPTCLSDSNACSDFHQSRPTVTYVRLRWHVHDPIICDCDCTKCLTMWSAGDRVDPLRNVNFSSSRSFIRLLDEVESVHVAPCPRAERLSMMLELLTGSMELEPRARAPHRIAALNFTWHRPGSTCSKVTC